MDILVKILFVLSLIVLDITTLKAIVDNLNDRHASIGWGALAIFNVIMVMLMFIIMHGDYLTGTGLLVASIFAGAVVISIATMLYVEIFDKPPTV